MAFNPDAYLGTEKPKGFDPDSYLGGSSFKSNLSDKVEIKSPGKMQIPGAPKPVNIEVKKEISLEEMAKSLPEIPDGIRAVDPDQADELFKTYEKAGKDPGYEAVTVLTPQGSQKIVRRKPQLSAQKPVTLEQQRIINQKIDEQNKKSVQERTSVFDQTMEGLTRPTEELLMGAATLATGDPSYLKSVGAGKENIPFGDLSPAQKVAYGAGAMLGYVGPGEVLNIAGKGLVKVGLNAIGKEAAVKAAQKQVTKFIGKTVAKSVPTDLAKQAIGSLAGKIINNAPTLAVEGALWEGIASGGDPERAMEGAFMFALGGPAAQVGGELAVKPVAKAVIRAVDDLKLTQAFRESNKRTPENLFEKPLNLDDETYQKVKQVEAFRLSALYETERDFLQAKVKVKLEEAQKQVARVDKTRAALASKRDLLIEKIKTKKSIEVEIPEPKSFNDLSVSFSTKAHLEDKFGSLKGLQDAAAGEGNDLLGVLLDSGLNQRQAVAVNRDLTVFDPRVKKIGPTAKAEVILADKSLSRIESQIKRVDKLKDQLEMKAATVRKNSVFNPNADTNILKEFTKDRYSADRFQRKALDAGIDISGVEMPKGYAARKWLNYTERHSMVEAQTGIPMSQVTMDLIESEYKKSHLSKASEAFDIAGNLKELRKVGVDGEQAWEWFHYIRTDKKTGEIKWDPSELKMGAYTVPEFKGEVPSKKVIDTLSNLRKMSDWHHDTLTKSGQQVGYTPGYVAIKPKVGFFTTTARLKDGAPKEAKLLQKRTTGLIPQDERHLYHTDLYELIPKMNRDAINAATFSPVVEKINVVDWMLRASGQKTRADDFLKYASRAMGYKNIDETIQVLSMDLVNKNEPLLKKLAEMSGGQRTLFQDAKSALYDMMYSSYIGLSPSGMIKQFVQPELVGAAEIGMKNVAFGKIGAYSPVNRKETKAALERVKDRLYPEKIDYAMMGETQRQWMKNLVKISNIPAKPGMALFSHVDNKNREVIFLGAINQFKGAAKKGSQSLSDVMSDLLPAERNRIIEAYNKYGTQEAMDTYGLIRSKRSNYAYMLAEKAEIFSEGFGSMVPFVNWGMNQWTRHFESVRQASTGKVMPLAAQIAYGVGGTIALQQILNERFYPTVLQTGAGTLSVSSGIPQSSLIGMGEVDPFTGLKGVLSGDVSAWVRYYKKTDGDILNPAKIFDAPKNMKKQRKIKGDFTDVIDFKRKKD